MVQVNYLINCYEIGPPDDQPAGTAVAFETLQGTEERFYAKGSVGCTVFEALAYPTSSGAIDLAASRFLIDNTDVSVEEFMGRTGIRFELVSGQ